MVARVLILYSVLQPLPVGIWSRADRLLSDLWIVSRAVFDLNVIGKASQTSFCSRQSLSRHRAMAASLELPMKRNWHRLHQSETFFLQKGEISEIWYSAAWRHLSGSVGPDWRFLKVLGDMVSIKSSPKAWLIFGLEWKATFFMLNYCGYFLGNVWKIWATFLIQHMVTLVWMLNNELFVKHFSCILRRSSLCRFAESCHIGKWWKTIRLLGQWLWHRGSVTRLGDFLGFGQLFNTFGNK